jgi:hypothetical protein
MTKCGHTAAYTGCRGPAPTTSQATKTIAPVTGGASQDEGTVKAAKPTYGISRVDNEVSRTHGWLVTIQRRGVIHRRHFSDGVHGSRTKAFAAAVAFRDEIVAKFPPLSLREYSSIVKKSNRSGVVGVCRYCASETRNLPEEQQRWFWVASWPLPSGKRKRVKFAVNKYGEEKAFKMALKARREAMRELEGSFDPGAARRLPRRRANGIGKANGFSMEAR